MAGAPAHLRLVRRNSLKGAPASKLSSGQDLSTEGIAEAAGGLASGSHRLEPGTLQSGTLPQSETQPTPKTRPQPDAKPDDATPDDAGLVTRATRGELAAFEALYRRHASFAINLAVRIQGNARDVEDIVHDAFLRAHDKLAELRDGQAFKSWLGSIVVSLVRARLRRRKLLGSFGVGSADPVDLDSIASESAGPEARAELAQVYALLQTLPADDRIAWTLRQVEHHRLEAVAELCGCSLATAKRRILRAQRFLKQHFVPAFEGEPDE